MSRRKTYYDPQDGQQYYHGEKLGAIDWDAPESVKDESYINQYNYTPSYNAYRQYLEEEKRREEELARIQMPATGRITAGGAQNPYEYTNPTQPTNNLDLRDVDAARTQRTVDRIKSAVDSAANPLTWIGLKDRVSGSDVVRDQQNDILVENYIPESVRANDRQNLQKWDQKDRTLTPDEEVEYSNAKLRQYYKQFPGLEKLIIEYNDYHSASNAILAGNESDAKKTNYMTATLGATNRVKKQIQDLTGWTDDQLAGVLKYADRVQDRKDTLASAKQFEIDTNATIGEQARKGAENTAYSLGNNNGINNFIAWGEKFSDNPKGFGTNIDSGIFRKINNSNAAVSETTKAIQEDAQKIVSAALGKEKGEMFGKLAGRAYEAGVSSIDSELTRIPGLIVSAATGNKTLGEAVGLAPYYFKSFNSDYMEARNKGATEQEAWGSGVMGGLIEVGTELIGMDNFVNNLMGKNAGKSFIKNLIKQMAAEGLEEGVSDVLNELVDSVLYSNDSEVKSRFEQRIEEKGSVKGAVADFLADIGLDTLFGAISAAPGSGGTLALGAHNYGNITQNISQNAQAASQDIKGDSSYEKSVREQMEQYAKNPTRYVADNMPVFSKEDRKRKADVMELAKKEEKGETLTAGEKLFIQNALAESQESMEKARKEGKTQEQDEKAKQAALEESQVPVEFRGEVSNWTEDEARTKLAEAAASGDAAHFAKVAQKVMNSSNEEVARNANEIISDYSGMAQSHGISQQDIGQAVLSEKKAYLAGLKGETLDGLSDKNKIAYNEGKQAAIMEKAKTTISGDALKNMSVSKKDGSKVNLAGAFTEDGIKTSDGIVKVEDLDLSSETANVKAYQYADRYDDVNAKNAFISNIKNDTNIEQYRVAFDKMYDSAMAGVSFENAKKSIVSQFADEDVLKAAYQTGETERKGRSYQSLAQALGDVKAGTGKVINESSSADADMVDFFGKLARRTGLTFKIVDELDRSNARGSFKVSESVITVRADKMDAVYHELGEFTETYNKEAYDMLRSAIADYSSYKLGNDKYIRYLNQYKAAYAKAGLDSSADEMSGEMFNDTISIIMRSDKGRAALADFLAKNYGAEEAKSIGQQAADLVHRFADAVKKAFKKSDKNGYEGEMEKFADQLGIYADMFVEALDGAVENYAKANKAENATSGEEKYQINITKGGIVKDAVITADQLNENLHKVHNMKSVADVSFYKLQNSKTRDAVNEMTSRLGSNNVQVNVKGLGTVTITGSSFGDIFTHSNKKTKASIIDAIIPTLEHGEIVAVDNPHKSRGYNTAVIVAPINFTNSIYKLKAGEHFVGVSVKRSPSNNVSNQGLHVVDIHTIKKGVRTTGSIDINQVSDTSTLSLYDILDYVAQDVNIYKPSNADYHFSLEVDSQGKKLTNGQREFFADESKLLLDENGALKRYYHGTARKDRVGTVFDPARATSGPMAFFTDDKGIAENYSKGKEDTSLSRDERYDSYYTQFRLNLNGKDVSIPDAWNMLPASKKQEIKQKAGHIAFDDDYDEIKYYPNKTDGNGAFTPYELHRHKGNYLETLVDTWLDTGDLLDREEDFLKVLELVGIKGAEYLDPYARDEGVYEVYLHVTNPLDTTNIPKKVVTALKKASKSQFFDEMAAVSDSWDKNRKDPQEWMDRLEEDIKDGTTHSWTSIPDWVTGILKEQGYDGIADLGGKGGGQGHQVVIPFESNQVKSIDNENPTENADIRFSINIDEDRVYYAPRLRGSLEIVKNATNEEYQQMYEELLKEMPWLRGTGTPLLRHTYDEEGNTYYWSAADGIHAQVEPLINKHWNTRTSQHWEWWLKDDKDEWPIDYSTRYSLGGIGAFMADINMLDKAREMEEAGETKDEIFDQTGWYRGADRKWRFEIDDSEAEITDDFLNNYEKKQKYTLAEVMDFRELYKKYPRLGQVKVVVDDVPGNAAAMYSSKDNTITIDEINGMKGYSNLSKSPKEELTLTLLHEIQHAIQHIEHFASGSNPGMWARRDRGAVMYTRGDMTKYLQAQDRLKNLKENSPKELVEGFKRIDWLTTLGEVLAVRDLYKELKAKYGDQFEEYYDADAEVKFFEPTYEELTAMEAYEMTAGEIEAREVEERHSWNKDMRHIIPTTTTSKGVLFAENMNDPWKVPEQFSLEVSGNASADDVGKALNLGAGEDVKYSIEVTDKKTLDFLENQKHIKTYRTFQKIGDGLYAPMNAMDGKNLGYKSQIGVWEQATEDPSKAVKRGNGYAFPLKAGNATTSGKARTTWAAYNPYLHSSNLVFNDQFSAAYDRPNLVVVECEVPVSEETSGYKADKAKDGVGWLDWKSGKVANALKKKGMERKVFLSRWMKPVRILSNAEVADIYKDSLEGTGIVVPWNVVSPPLREELEKRGVDIDYGYQSSVKASFDDKFSLDLGYHAGDLGKAESLFQSSGGRSTGHFGTGTYFVGDEEIIKGLSGYKDRPHYTVDFSKYNLYKPANTTLGLKLHEFLKGVNSFYNMKDDDIKTVREWETRKDDLEYNLEEGNISKEDAIKEARTLFGNYNLQRFISKEAAKDGEYWYGDDGTVYDPRTETKYSYEEFVKDWDDDRFTDMMYDLIYDNKYAPRYLEDYADFNREMEFDAKILFGISEEKAREIIQGIRNEIKAANYGYNEMKVADSASTRFMKALGYEGIDVRGLKGLDNTTYGSVIYDLKGEDLEQKIANGARYSLEVDSEGSELTEGQQRYFNNSKVVDDEGRLKVMYHGTLSAGFTVFDNSYSDDYRSFFFTDNPEVAESYSDSKEKFFPSEPLNYKDLREFVETVTDGDMFVQKDGDDIVVMENLYSGATEVYRGDLKGAREYVNENADIRVNPSSANYTVYLNLENPLVIDAEGRDWNDLHGIKDSYMHYNGVAIYRSSYGGYESYQVDYNKGRNSYHENFESLEALEKKFGKIYEPFEFDEVYIEDLYLDKKGERIPNNTRMYSEYAQANGYDGVIFKNLVDVGQAADIPFASTIAIAFNPEQIKYINNLNPTSSEDIRYSLTDIDDDFVSFDDILQGGSQTDEKAVDILEKGMEALKNKEVDLPKLRTLALKIRNEYGSTYNTNTLTENLRKAFAYMQTEDHVDYKTMMGILRDIARPVIEQSGEKVGEQEYKDFISYFKGMKIKLTSKQKDEVKYAFGSYKAFRNAIMPITISDNGDTTLEQIWDELVEQSGYAVDRDVVEGDMPAHLLDVLQSMRPTLRNDYGADIDDMAKDLAMRIVEEYIEGESAKQMHKEIAEIRQRLKKDYQERRKELEGQVNAEARARNKRRAEQAKEREDVRKLKNNIKSNANKLITWIQQPTEGKSVPHNMVSPVIQFLQAIDFVDPIIRQREDGKWTTKIFDHLDMEEGSRRFIYKDLVGDSYDDVLKQFNEAIGRGEGSKAQRSWTEKMQGVRDIFNKVRNNEDFEDTSLDFLMQGLDGQGLAEEFDDLLSRNNGQANMNHLSSSDLTIIDNVIRNIIHAVNQGNKAYSQPSVDIINLAQSTIKDSEGKEVKERNKILEGMHKLFRLDNVTPRTFFKLLGNRGVEVYKFLRGGLNQEISDLKKASEFVEGLNIDKKEVKKWTGRTATIHEFALSSGTVRLTDGQIMGLYMTVRRSGAMDRIKGGIVPDVIRTNTAKLRQEAIHLTEKDISQIEAVLTPEQIAIAKSLQQYMAKDCSEQGNETSRRLYGFEKFVDPTYYPWTVDRETVATNNTSENIPMFTGIERSGFTKQLKKGATNPLVIRDIFDVFTDHVSQMAAYHGYAAAVKDTLRWMNYREQSRDNGFVRWITNKSAINKLTGSDKGVGYISTLLLDINKANKSQYIGNITDRLMGNYKAAAVGANLRVVAQQPTAYFRALNMIDPKYLLTVNPKTAIKNIKVSQEESPISWWKSKGYYETNLGQPIKEIVTGIASPMERAKDIMMSPAGWADDFTWGFLYTAVEKEQRDKLKGQNITPEEFRKAVNDRFDEVVDNTQVVDSTLHRSQYMRSKDTLNKIQTAFMAEPTKSYNMLLEAALEDLNEGKTMKRSSRAVASFLVSALATSAAAAVVDAMRKAGDDDEWWEVWLKNLKENVADNMNPFNLLPVVKDMSAAAYSAMTGKSTFGAGGSRFDTEAIYSVANAVTTIWNAMRGEKSNKTGYGMFLTIIKPISQITGIPVYNLTKDTVALYNTFFDNIETTLSKGSTAKNEIKKEFVKDVNREKSEDTLDEGISNALEHGVSIYDLKGAVQSEYKNKYFDAYTEGSEEEAKEIADRAARAYARMGLTDEEIDDIINGWQEEVITYAELDKAIASGEEISTSTMRVRQVKDDDKIIKHLMDRFSDTIAYEDTHNTESHWRENVEKAIRTVDPTLSFDTAHDEAMEKAAKKAEEKAVKDHNQEMKNEFFNAVDRKDGAAGRQALETMKSEGIEAKTVKSAVSTYYHDAWKEAETPSEREKAKADWKSAYTLVNNVYGSKSNDLDKTWSEWEAKQ